jgi:hypothetical protein
VRTVNYERSARAVAMLAMALALAVLAACGRAADEAAPPAAPTHAANATPASPNVPATPATPSGSVVTPVADGYTALDDFVIAPEDTLERLRARHGDANVVTGPVPGAEGEEFEGWILFPDDASRRLYVYLDDARTHPAAARVLDPESRWQRIDGVRTGLTLAELAERNGAPVTFTGFDWDYGGTVTGWNHGRLDRDVPLGGITLCPPEGDDASGPDYPSGDAEFDSGNAWVVAHPPHVCAFALNLNP